MNDLLSIKKSDFIVKWVVFSILALGFSVRKSATALPMLLVVAGLYLLWKRHDFRILAIEFFNDQWKVIVALAVLPLLILIRELIQSSPELKYVDAASRFLFFMPICVLLIYSRIRLEDVRWGFFGGVVFMFASGFIYVYMTGGFDSGSNYAIRPRSYFTNPIPFSAFCVALAIVFSVWSIGRSTIDTICSVVSILLAVLVLYFSQSRGVWIGFLFSILSIVLMYSKNRVRDFSLFFVFSFVVLVLLYCFSEMFAIRVDMAMAEVLDFMHGKKDGSVSMRLDMAMASFYILQENPIFGAGRNLIPALQDLYHRGVIGAAISDAADTHGELFYNAASLGVLGTFAWLAFYYFIIRSFLPSALISDCSNVKRIGVIGTSITVLFFFVGFTHITFGLSMYASYFLILLSILSSSLKLYGRQ